MKRRGVGGTLEGTHVSLSSQQFICMPERLLDRTTTHCTIESTCTHLWRCCLPLLCHFQDVDFTALWSSASESNESNQTLSSHALAQDLILFPVDL